MPRIRLVGNDIEIDGQKVARVLDLYSSLRSCLEEFIDKADSYKELDAKAKSLDERIKTLTAEASEAYDAGKTDGYAEGREDGKG